MGSSKSLQYYHSLIVSFRSNFKKLKQSRDKNDLHKFRVSIKKLMVMLTLMEYASNSSFNKKDHYQLFSKLFRLAGKLREVQLQINSLLKHEIKTSHFILNQMGKMEKRHYRELMEEMKNFRFGKLKKLDEHLMQTIENVDDETYIIETTTLVTRVVKKINRQLNKVYDEHDLHGIRSHLRAIMEITIYLKELNPSFSWGDFEESVLSLNKSIGKWHDRLVMINSIAHYIKKKPKDQEIKKLKKIKKKIEKKNRSTRKKIDKKLNAFILQNDVRNMELALEVFDKDGNNKQSH